MIIIDGRQSDMQLGNFENLEEILVNAMETESLEDRVVTDVFVNEESFSELYPHQAEDVDASGISKVEICSVSVAQLASDVTTELYKVITLMTTGGHRSASLLRKAEILNGLEVLQDVVEVTRHFLGTVALLRDGFAIERTKEISALADSLGNVVEEMNDMIGQEDWILLADLLEFEFLPACESWNSILGVLAHDIEQFQAA